MYITNQVVENKVEVAIKTRAIIQTAPTLTPLSPTTASYNMYRSEKKSSDSLRGQQGYLWDRAEKHQSDNSHRRIDRVEMWANCKAAVLLKMPLDQHGPSSFCIGPKMRLACTLHLGRP